MAKMDGIAGNLRYGMVIPASLQTAQTLDYQLPTVIDQSLIDAIFYMICIRSRIPSVLLCEASNTAYFSPVRFMSTALPKAMPLTFGLHRQCTVRTLLELLVECC